MKKQTSGLKIESLNIEKLGHLQKWLDKEEVHKNLYILHRPMSFKELEKWHKKEHDSGSQMFFYSTGKTMSEPAGIGLIHYIHSKNRCGELSVIINPELSGKGYGKQVLQHLMLTGFEVLNLHKIFAHAVEFNKRSISLLEKMNFIREAKYRKELYWAKKYYGIYRYSMLEDEYYRSE